MRGDLACISLAGRIFAPHYVVPNPWHCTSPSAAIHGDPNGRSEIVGELLAGEPFALMDRTGDWAWGQASDGSCGFVVASDLAPGPGAMGSTAQTDIADFALAALGRDYADGGQGGAGYCGVGLVRRAALAQGVALASFIDLQAASDALIDADGPASGTFLFAGEVAAICVSDSEAVAALPDRGVVRLPIADLLDGVKAARPLYRRIPA